MMDIVQNSISAKATEIGITVYESKPEDRLVITITDNGRGMTREQVQSVINPFYTTRTTRPVGLGVPLFKMEAEMTGGSLEVQSELGKGTVIKAVFVPSHIDMIPLGDINATVLPLITGNPEINFMFSRVYVDDKGETREFSIKTSELVEILGDIPLASPDVVLWIRDFLKENTQELLG